MSNLLMIIVIYLNLKEIGRFRTRLGQIKPIRVIY